MVAIGVWSVYLHNILYRLPTLHGGHQDEEQSEENAACWLLSRHLVFQLKNKKLSSYSSSPFFLSVVDRTPPKQTNKQTNRSRNRTKQYTGKLGNMLRRRITSLLVSATDKAVHAIWEPVTDRLPVVPHYQGSVTSPGCTKLNCLVVTQIQNVIQHQVV